MSNSNDSSETVSVDPDVEMLDLEPQSVAAAADKENQTSLPVNRQTLATTTTVHQSTAATTAANTTSGGGYRSPWVELYRPRTLSDVLGNEETILRLRAIAKDGNLPNLILCGPPGTGTCSVLNAAISRECNRNARHWILTFLGRYTLHRQNYQCPCVGSGTARSSLQGCRFGIECLGCSRD
jgi:hypothetical protein